MMETPKIKSTLSLQNMLNKSLLENRVLVDGKSKLPVSLTPYIIEHDECQGLYELCKNVYTAIEKLLRVYVDDPTVQSLFPELEKYRELSCLTPDYNNWIHLCRFDVVRTPEGKFKIMETNCDCPGAILFVPKIKRIFRELKLLEPDIYENEIEQKMDTESFFIKSLVSVYNQYRDSKLPNIAFLSSKYKPITSDMDLFENIGNNMGLKCTHEKVQNLQIKNDTLCTKNFIIDVTYQKFDAFIDEDGQAKPCIFDQSPCEVEAYWKSIQNKRVLTFNSFPSTLVGENKRILALLKMSRFQKYFTQSEKEAISELCPNTYSLVGLTEKDPLITNIIENKDKYVLKRTIDTRGRGVFVGRQLNHEEWQQLIKLSLNSAYVVQEYIEHPKNAVQSPDNEDVVEMYSNLAVFIIRGEPCGLLSRSSRNIVTNVGQNGCFRPVYILKNNED